MPRQRKKDIDLPTRVYKKHGAYYFVGPNNKWLKLATSKPAALAKYYQIIARPKQLTTISDLIDRYMSEVSPQKAPSTHEGEVQEARNLRGALGHIPPNELTTQMVYEYLDIRTETAPIRANREIALLSHMFKKAIRWGAATENPVLGVERNPEKPRTRYITDEELLAFKLECPEWLALYCDFKYLTGLRQKDMLQLKWSQVTQKGISLTVSKTTTDAILGWSDSLRCVIESIKAIDKPISSLHLFHTRKGQPYSPSGFRSIFHRAMRRALDNKSISKPFQERDIRAKSASDSKSLEAASRLLIHSSVKVTKRHYMRQASIIEPLK